MYIYIYRYIYIYICIYMNVTPNFGTLNPPNPEMLNPSPETELGEGSVRRAVWRSEACCYDAV